MRVVTIRRWPNTAFGPAPLGYPLTPPVDLGAGFSVGDHVTVMFTGVTVEGTVTALDAEWITVTAE